MRDGGLAALHKVAYGDIGPFISKSIVVSGDAPENIRHFARQMKQTFGSRVQLCDGIDDDVEIKAALGTSATSVVLLGGNFNYNLLNGGLSLSSRQSIEISSESTITTTGDTTERWLFDVNGTTAAVSSAGVHGSGRIILTGAKDAVLRLRGDVKDFHWDERIFVTHSNPDASTCLTPFYLLGNANWGIRDCSISPHVDGVSFGATAEDSGVLFMEGNVRHISGKIRARRVNYGIGTHFVSVRPTECYRWDSNNSTSNLPNLIDGNLTTTNNLQILATRRLVFAHNLPFNSFYIFFTTPNTTSEIFMVVETPRVANPSWTIGTSDWYTVPIMADETIITTAGVNQIPFGRDGEVAFGYIPEEKWVRASVGGVILDKYLVSVRFVDRTGASVSTSSMVVNEIHIAACPSDCVLDAEIYETRNSGYHWRCSHRFTTRIQAGEITNHITNDNSTDTTGLTTNDRYFATRDCVTYINGGPCYDTAVLQRRATNCRVFGTVVGVMNSTGYEQDNGGKDLHKPRNCTIDLVLKEVGRIGARIQGDDNEIKIHLINAGQLYTLVSGSVDRTGCYISLGGAPTPPQGNKLWLTIEDYTGNLRNAISSQAGTTGVNTVMSLVAKGVVTATVDDLGGALAFATPPLSDLAGSLGSNKGTASIESLDLSTTVTHGLFRAPGAHRIRVISTSNATSSSPGHIWVDNINATQFTINTRVATGGITFAWEADVVNI